MAATTPRPAPTSIESGFAALFSRVGASLPGASWLQSLRNEAMTRLLRDGIPHRRQEWWKYTDLRSRVSNTLDVASAAFHAEPDMFSGIACHRVELSAGKTVRLPSQADLPDGLEIISLADAVAMPSLWLRPWLLPSGQVIENLNLAFASDGALVRVGRGIRVEQPVLLRTTLSEPGVMANTRSVIALEEGAELTLIELDDGAPERQNLGTAVTAYILEAGARLRHLRVSAAGSDAIVLRSDTVEIGRDASYDAVIVTAGGSLVRHQMSARLIDSGADFSLATAYAAGEGQHADNSLEIIHEAPHTKSRILAKGVASHDGRGVVQGRVVVRPDAQKSDSHQMSRALLLTPGAEIDQRPELEIFADDVKCGHGATIGSLDANQLFYLTARGIPEPEARNLLVAAFMAEVTDRVPEALRSAVETWLGSRMCIP